MNKSMLGVPLEVHDEYDKEFITLILGIYKLI